MRVRAHDAVGAGVNVRVWVQDLRTGLITLHDEGHNLVTAAGLDLLCDRLRNVGAPLSHFAVGTGVAAPAPGDTALALEVFRDIYTQVTTAPGSITYRYFLGPNDANGNTIREAGLFNASTGGTLAARRVLTSPIEKNIDTASTFEWTLSLAAL